VADKTLEVKLVNQVRTCRTCQWFWGGVPPYGNFPLYDWNEDFPEAVRKQQQTTDWVTEPMMHGKACGQGQVDPGVMHGCRKAPIMTIGINPNMTAYFPSEDGMRWSYPGFSKDARYAYYYRHHSVYQESLDPDFIQKNVITGTAIVAEEDGWLVNAERSADHRWLLLTLRYKGEETDRELEVAWTSDARFVVFVERSFRIVEDRPGFKKGQLIGGKIAGLVADDVQIYANSAGYYQRYVHVLERFKAMVGGDLGNAPLSITEDVAQHDMIACASPGWSTKYDIPRDKITDNCVFKHGWLLSQLIQSRPAVIVIVGGSSMAMFGSLLKQYLGDLDYMVEVEGDDGKVHSQMMETFQLLRKTVEGKYYLRIQVGDYELRSRLVISPHFSYSSNFETQVRLSSDAWTAFQNDFPLDTEVLQQQGRVQPNDWNDIVPIQVSGQDDEIATQLSAGAWGVLMAYFYDPIEMLAEVLKQEYDAGNIAYSQAFNRLERAGGSCHFCVNEDWTFPEQCPYKKNEEPAPEPGYLENVVNTVLSAAG